MSAIRSAVIRALDRPGGRRLLGHLATGFVRRATGRREVAVRFEDGYWVRTLGDGISVFDTTQFDFHTEGLRSWEEHDRVVRDVWLHAYDPRPGDVIMEVGAGTGLDLAVFSRAVGAGTVYGVEAHPRTFEMLQRTVAKSGLENIVLVHRAIADAGGTVRIQDQHHHTENRLLPPDGEGKGAWSSGKGFWEVTASTLDDLAEELGIVELDYLKMNIEGAESLAIRGMSGILSKTERVCIACHDFIGDEVDDDWYRTKDTVVEFLRDQGFDVTTRDSDHRPQVRDQVWGVRSA